MANSGKRVTGTVDVTTGPTKLWMLSGVTTTAGTLALRDGGASGTLKATVDVPVGAFAYPIPYGMSFPNGLHVTYTTAAGGVTFWL